MDGLWATLDSIWKVKKEVEDLVKKGLWMLIGDGKSTLFWKDLWVGDYCLKEGLPRLNSISSQKETTISKCEV